MNTKLNKSDYILIAVVYFVSTLLNIYEYYKEDNNLIEYFVDIPVSIICAVLTILLFMYWLIPKYLFKKKSFLLFAVFGLIILAFFGVIQYLAGFWSGNGDWSKSFKWDNIILNGIYNIIDDVGFTFGLLLTKKFYESQTQLHKTQEQQKENELKLLRSQLDPHFLFNNLNTLDSLIDSNTEKAKEYINRLSLIYRYLIKTKDAEVMELSEEIKLAENYMFLIKTRFENDYDFKIETRTDLSDKFIPTGAIQALLENVVKHNKPQNNKAIEATILIEENTLKVINTKSTLVSKNESFGTGLKNLKARYKLLSDKEVTIINTEKAHIISIPIINLIEEN